MNPRVTALTFVVTSVALLAIIASVIASNSYPQIDWLDFIAKNQKIFIPAAGACSALSWIFHLCVLTTKREVPLSNSPGAIEIAPDSLEAILINTEAIPHSDEVIEEANKLPEGREEKPEDQVNTVKIELAISRNLGPLGPSEAIHANTFQNPYLAKNPEALQGRVLQKKIRAIHVKPSPSIHIVSEKATLHQKARQVIAQSKGDQGLFYWQQFALMNDTFRIHGTRYDRGIQSFTAITSYISYLESRNEAGLFFELKDGKQGIQQLIQTLKDAKKGLTLMPISRYGSIKTDESTAVLTHLNTLLLKQGYAYMLSGYCGAGNEPGHAVTCKFRKTTLSPKQESEHPLHLNIYFLNLGEGVQHQEYHPLVDCTPTQCKVTRCNYPSQISWEDWKVMGTSFIAHLVRFATDSSLDKKEGHSSLDLYELQAALAPPNPSLMIPLVDHMGGKPQYVGDCADKAIRNMIIDFVSTELQFSPQQISRLFLNIHLASILAAFHALRKQPDPEHKILLLDGAQEFATFLLRSKEQLTREEFLLAGEIIDVIIQDINNFQEPLEKKVIPNHGVPLQLPAIPLPEQYYFEMPLREKSLKEIDSVPIQPFSVQSFHQDLGNIIDVWENGNLRKNFNLSEYVFSLPTPCWQNDPVWDTIPPQEIPGIICNLKKIQMKYGYLCSEAERGLLGASIYAIADKLVRRVEGTGLEKFATPFFLEEHEHHLAFMQPQWEKKYLQLKVYFLHNRQANQNKIILLDVTKEQLEKYVEVRKSDTTSPGRYLLDYLDQFNTSDFFFAKKSDNYLNIFQGLPQVCHDFFSLAQSLKIPAIFAPYKGKVTNEILCEKTTPVECKDLLETLSHEILQELALLNHYPELKIGLAIQWIQSHTHELNDTAVQGALECCFFSPGVLKERIELLPEIIEEVRALVEKKISEIYPNNVLENYSAMGFLIRLGITFEVHVAQILNHPINLEVCGKYEQQLLEILSTLKLSNPKEDPVYLTALVHYLYLLSIHFKNTSVDTLQNFKQLYTHLFKHSIRTWSLKSYIPDSLCFLNNFHNQVLQRFHDFLNRQGTKGQEVLNTVCTEIVTFLFQNEMEVKVGKWQWISNTQCYFENYVLDFHEMRIHHRFFHCSLIHVSPREIKDFHLKQFNLDSKKYWWQGSLYIGGNIFSTLDESVHVVKQNGPYSPFLIKKENVDKFRMPHFKAYPFFLGLSPLTHFLTTNHQGKQIVVSYHQENQKPFIQMEFDNPGVVVTRIDEEGNPLPFKLADLKNLQPQHPLYPFTLQYAPYDKQLCFINEMTGEIEELYFPHLKLIFKKKEGGLELNESGFYLTPISLTALKSLSKHAMIVRNAKGKIKIILVIPPREELPLGSNTELEDHVKSYSFDKCTFHLSSPNNRIEFTTFSEHLFFIYFLKAHGDYARAFSELKKIKTIHFDDKTFTILLRFFKLEDHSPFSLAFNLRLILFFTDHFHLFKKGTLKTCKNLLLMSFYWYEQYLRVLGDDHFKGIPSEWILSESEERRILTIFIQEKIPLTKSLSVREKILYSEDRTVEIELSTQAGPSSVFSSVVPVAQLSSLYLRDEFPYDKQKVEWHWQLEKDHNRISSSYLKNNFSHFYNLAIEAKPGLISPFDLTLLTLLKTSNKESKGNKEESKSSNDGSKLASLLFYVRHFSDQFKDLRFSGSSIINAKIFNIIILKLLDLESTPEFKNFQKTVLEKRSDFEYTKKIALALPPLPSIPSIPLPALDAWDIENKPFADLFGTLFKPQEGASYEGLTLFDTKLIGNQLIEQELLKEYSEAYSILNSQKETLYQLQPEALPTVLKELKRCKEDYLVDIGESQKRILDYVNAPFSAFFADFTLEQEREFQIFSHSHQTYQITPEMIMQKVILSHCSALFAVHRPMLKEEHIKVIVEETHHYYHLKVLETMCSDAIKNIESLMLNIDDPITEKGLLETLGYTFLYNPLYYPEIAYMKIKTGKLPRPDQALIYQWVCEGLEKQENRLFQLPAGGGKTTYLIPLLIMRSKRLKLMPCILTTQAMYSTEKENFYSTLNLLEYGLDPLEVSMHDQLSLIDLKRIYQNLKKTLQLGNALIVTPQTFYALRLMYFISAVEQDDRVKMFEKILFLFSNYTLLLGDESHRNFNALTQAIFGIGDFVNLPHLEFNHLFHLTVSVLAMHSSEMKLNKGALQAIQKQVAAVFSQDAEIIAFLTNKKIAEPAILGTLTKEQRHLAFMTRYFIHSLLPKVLKTKVDFDHVFSQDQGEIDTPAYHRTPSHAQYKDPYLTTALTIKGMWHRGLSKDQFYKLIKHLKELHHAEQALSTDITPCQKRFHEWIKKPFPSLTLDNLKLENDKQMQEMFDHLKKHPQALKYYLEVIVKPFIGYSSEQLVSTPAHLMDMVKCSILFSATPRAKIAYPQALKEVKIDPLFEIKVVAQASKEKNQRFIFHFGPDQFFEKIKTNKRADVRYMVDAEGLLCSMSNDEVAERWLDSSLLDGVIYFKEGDTTDKESLCLRLKDQKEIEFKGTHDIKRSLALHDIDLDSKAIGFYFDAPHAESANFPPIPQTSAYILVGHTVTLSHAIQSIMRLRGFLDERMDERIIWVVPNALVLLASISHKFSGNSHTPSADLDSQLGEAVLTQHCPHPTVRQSQPTERQFSPKICEKCRLAAQESFHSSTLFSLFLQNEAKAIRQVLLMTAFQEISFAIEKIAFANCPDQAEAIKKNIEGFKKTFNPNEAWTTREQSVNTDKLLWDFASELYESFHFTIPFDQQTQLKEQIQGIIDQTHQKISQAVVNFHARSLTHTHQKCMIKIETSKLQFYNGHPDINGERLKPHLSIADPSYPLRLNPDLQVRKIFKTEHLSDNLYLEINQLYTAKVVGGESLKEKFLKPIYFLMIVIHGKHVIAEAVSPDILIHHIEALKNPPPDQDIQHQAFIIRADGIMYLEGRGVLAPDKQRCQEILNSTWLQDVLIDCALLRGCILNPNRFDERVHKWPDFLQFWTPILKAQPHPKEYLTQALSSYLNTDH